MGFFETFRLSPSGKWVDHYFRFLPTHTLQHIKQLKTTCYTTPRVTLRIFSGFFSFFKSFLKGGFFHSIKLSSHTHLSLAAYSILVTYCHLLVPYGLIFWKCDKLLDAGKEASPCSECCTQRLWPPSCTSHSSLCCENGHNNSWSQESVPTMCYFQA